MRLTGLFSLPMNGFSWGFQNYMPMSESYTNVRKKQVSY